MQAIEKQRTLIFDPRERTPEVFEDLGRRRKPQVHFQFGFQSRELSEQASLQFHRNLPAADPKQAQSLANYIGITEPPRDIFGKVMSISDALMFRYYELLTTEELSKVKALHPMEAKQALAQLLVARYHGEEAGRQARLEFQQKFQKQEFPSEPDVRLTLTVADLKDGKSISLADLVAKTGLIPSKSEARRLIIQGGLEVDEQKQTDANGVLTLVAGQVYRLKIGRRKFAVVELQG